MDADTELDIELVASAMVPRIVHGSPTLSGVVFESTSEGRRPIPGAFVSYDTGCYGHQEFAEAGVRTDSNGRYELCRLPLELGSACVIASAAGRQKEVKVHLSGDAVLDIDIEH